MTTVFHDEIAQKAAGGNKKAQDFFLCEKDDTYWQWPFIIVSLKA
jgi:hypothetical protein